MLSGKCRIKDWHGIPEAMMDDEVDRPSDGILIVAKRLPQAIMIYAGPLQPLIRGRNRLNRATRTTGDYQFIIAARLNHLNINQIPGMTLQLIEKLPYSDDQKKQDQRLRDVEKQFDGLSDVEKRN